MNFRLCEITLIFPVQFHTRITARIWHSGEFVRGHRLMRNSKVDSTLSSPLAASGLRKWLSHGDADSRIMPLENQVSSHWNQTRQGTQDFRLSSHTSKASSNLHFESIEE
jgi:hypothetical protein